MSLFERPGPDLDKIIEVWRGWDSKMDQAPTFEVESEGETSQPPAAPLPGRTMADLKIAGADQMLEALAVDSESNHAIHAIWSSWETGKCRPEETLTQLAAAGFGMIVDSLAAAQG